MKKKWIALFLVLAVMMAAWLGAMDSFALDRKETQASLASAGESQPEQPEKTETPIQPEETEKDY